MQREYLKSFSRNLGREMEMLVFGHGGYPVIVFPTSCGRFFEFEDRHMVSAIAHKIEAGLLQLFCVDSVDAESWYNREVEPRWRIARQMQYQDYVMREILPIMARKSDNQKPLAIGCSFGAFHAANLSLRHPDIFAGFLAMGGAFDVSGFLHGYYDDDCYFNLPTHYLSNLNDAWYSKYYGENTYVLATGEHDICRGANESMAALMRAKGIPVRLDVWNEGSKHDWPWWERMIQVYL